MINNNMKDKDLILIVALLFSLGVVSGMIAQQHKVNEVNNINKAYKEEIGKRLDEIKKVKTENNSYKVIIGAQTEVMRKAIQEIELRQAEALYFKQKYEAAVSKLSI